MRHDNPLQQQRTITLSRGEYRALQASLGDANIRIRELEEAMQGLLEAVGWPQETDEDCEYIDERVDAARAVLGNASRENG